jgi:hypothetical protein
MPVYKLPDGSDLEVSDVSLIHFHPAVVARRARGIEVSPPRYAPVSFHYYDVRHPHWSKPKPLPSGYGVTQEMLDAARGVQ